jgi:tetratricopeptide (TPR) repeat protein
MRGLRRRVKYQLLAGGILTLCTYHSFAQEHLIQRPKHKLLRIAEEQYGQGHYRLASKSAAQYLNQCSPTFPNAEGEQERARYIQTISGLKLDLEGSADSAKVFIGRTGNPVYQQRTSFALAQYYFRHEELNNAIPYYENANISNLTNEEIANAKFELAYSYFNSKQFEKAEPLFASIKEVPGKYYLAGNYYYGLLAYNEGKYEDALTSFKRVDNEKQYRNIVPYYIAEIYYFKGDRKQALDDAIRLTRRTDKLFYDNELHLLAAQVLFEEQRYGEALPYFEHYYENTDEIRKEELYEMAYSYYRVNEWKNAIEKFKPLSNAQDSLGQTAMYLLGDCYLKINDKKSARNAFSICADMPYNRGQQEASLLLYGKLSYDLGYNDDAVRSFTTLAQEFPHSLYISEAKTLLSDLFVKTHRYAEAYHALKDVSERNSEYYRVRQKVTYGYAMKEMQNGNLGFADSLFSISLDQPADNTYEAASLFWRGDIAYRQNRYADALRFLEAFASKANERVVAALSPQATLANANVNMGYAAMEQQDYAAAQAYFAKARQGSETNSPVAVNASVREADAAFMQKNYKEALNIYDRAIAANTPESDYALLQKSIISGLQGKTSEKVAILQQLINKPPPSRFSNDARYELAITHIEDNKYQQAITLLQPLTANEEGKNYAAKAWLRIGFSYQELKNDAKAIEAYQHIITDFPASEDQNTALEALRSLYIESNQPEAYANLLKEYNLPSSGSGSLDSTFYATAEAQIAASRWANAKSTLTQYLERFPNGFFATKAHYYKAESHYHLKETEAALMEYDAVLALPWNEFSEASAKRGADLAMKGSNYIAATKYYSKLRISAMSKENLELAYAGLLKASYNNNQFLEASNYADTLLSMRDLNETTSHEVLFFKAKALQRQSKNTEAMTIYQQLQSVKNEPVAAEARYRIAELYLAQNELKAAEEAAGNAIKLNAGNEYWVVKSYLLIVDVLVKQKDYFNAKATLQSIKKNTKNADLRKEAGQRLDEVKKLEKEVTKLKAE